MKIACYPETRTVYLTLIDGTSADTLEIASGVNVDFDAEGRPIGIEIEDTDLLPGFQATLQQS